MNFLKEWILNLLSLIIIIFLPLVSVYITYLLVKYLGVVVLFIILLIVVSLAITIKNLD